MEDYFWVLTSFPPETKTPVDSLPGKTRIAPGGVVSGNVYNPYVLTDWTSMVPTVEVCWGDIVKPKCAAWPAPYPGE